MIKNKLQNITATLIASVALLAPLGLNAADTATPSNSAASAPAKAATSPAAKTPAEKKVANIPFRGHVVAVDKSVNTFSIGKKSVRVFAVTSKTKITKEDAAATFGDLAVGEKVTGSYVKTADGKLEAISVKIGKDEAKTKTETPAKGSKKESAAPSPSPKA